VPNEPALLDASRKLDEAGVSHRLFREPDIGDQATALATAALSGPARRSLRKFQCLKEIDMKPSQVQVANEEVDGCYKSRWGYHACDYVTWKKLKALRRFTLLTRRQLATHDRWYRKEPQNRVWRTYKYNADHQRIGVLGTVPMSKPHVNEIMSDASVLATTEHLCQRTRRPSATPVNKLTPQELSIIDRLYEQVVAYEASR
jgi:hypothetical protein